MCPVWHLGCCSDSMVGAVTKEKKTDYKERELGPEEKLPRVRKSEGSRTKESTGPATEGSRSTGGSRRLLLTTVPPSLLELRG